MVNIISDLLVTSGQKLSGKPDVVILLDASGSMSGYRSTVVSTFNEYVQSIKETAHSVSLYTFDSDGIREKLFKVNPSQVPTLTERDYAPCAMTPLYDAMGIVMTKFDISTRPVQFVTHTDGAENHSSEWNFERINEYMKILEKKGWMFVHLGEGVEGAKQVASFGSGLKMQMNDSVRGKTMRSLSDTTSYYAQTGVNQAAAYTGGISDTVDLVGGGDINIGGSTAQFLTEDDIDELNKAGFVPKDFT